MTVVGAPSDICPELGSLVYGYSTWKSEPSRDAFFAMGWDAGMVELGTIGLVSSFHCSLIIRYAGCKSSYNISTSTEGVPRAQKNVAWTRIEVKTRRAEMPKPGMSVIVSGQTAGTLGWATEHRCR
ncbi:hypothetical protein C8R47DRAFT_1081624 [Mycena vitilis]|nr:hypothetical protein C8R47DRAFT_1081624 [Mycena vitilis]